MKSSVCSPEWTAAGKRAEEGRGGQIDRREEEEQTPKQRPYHFKLDGQTTEESIT